MALDTQQQAVLLDIGLGFVLLVVGVHAGEALLLAAQLRRWALALAAVLLLPPLGVVTAWTIAQRFHTGLRFDDVLVCVGVQVAAMVCVPSRWLRRRKCTWDRTRLQDTLTGWYTSAPVMPPRRTGIWPFTRESMHRPDAAGPRRR